MGNKINCDVLSLTKTPHKLKPDSGPFRFCFLVTKVQFSIRTYLCCMMYWTCNYEEMPTSKSGKNYHLFQTLELLFLLRKNRVLAAPVYVYALGVGCQREKLLQSIID